MTSVGRARALLAEVVMLWADGTTAEREGIAAAIAELLHRRPPSIFETPERESGGAR